MAYGQKSISKEKTVVNLVKEYLSIKKMPHWRINSGALRNKSNRLVRFGAKGMSDIYAIGKNGVSIWIECKRESGGKLSKAQKEFLDCINRNGGIGIVVNSLDSLEKQLKDAGVI